MLPPPHSLPSHCPFTTTLLQLYCLLTPPVLASCCTPCTPGSTLTRRRRCCRCARARAASASWQTSRPLPSCASCRPCRMTTVRPARPRSNLRSTASTSQPSRRRLTSASNITRRYATQASNPRLAPARLQPDRPATHTCEPCLGQPNASAFSPRGGGCGALVELHGAALDGLPHAPAACRFGGDAHGGAARVTAATVVGPTLARCAAPCPLAPCSLFLASCYLLFATCCLLLAACCLLLATYYSPLLGARPHAACACPRAATARASSRAWTST